MIAGESIKEIDINDIEPSSDRHFFLIAEERDIERVGSKFGLTQCTSRQCIERGRQTGIETYKHYYYIMLNIPNMKDGRVVTDKLDIYFGINFIILVVEEKTEFVEAIEEEAAKNSDVIFSGVPSPVNKLLYLLLDSLVLKGLEIVARMESKVEEQEERILKTGRRHMVNDLIFLKRQIHKMRRLLGPLTYVSDMLLLNEIKIINNQMLKYFNSAGLKFSQLNRDINGLYHSMESLRETYEAEISNQLNEIMKVFTIISSIFLPLTLVTGIYGMNFEYMPELGFRYGYFVVLGFMACAAGVLIVVFRKKKWI